MIHLQGMKIVFKLKNHTLLIFTFLMTILSTFGQKELDSIKPKRNHIYFGEISIGYASGDLSGISGGLSLNYQRKNNLFTFRILETTRIEKVDFFFGVLPYNIDSKTLREYSFLFGKRTIKNDFGYHFSGGISYVNFKEIKNDIQLSNVDYIGLPLEIGINWFNRQKERYRAYFGLIPVGKPTSFGRSVGFKLYATIAKKSVVGLGLTIGLGNYKNYGK